MIIRLVETILKYFISNLHCSELFLSKTWKMTTTIKIPKKNPSKEQLTQSFMKLLSYVIVIKVANVEINMIVPKNIDIFSIISKIRECFEHLLISRKFRRSKSDLLDS